MRVSAGRGGSFAEKIAEVVPAHRVAQLAECFRLDLADALARHGERLSDLFEGMIDTFADAEPHAQDALLAR